MALFRENRLPQGWNWGREVKKLVNMQVFGEYLLSRVVLLLVQEISHLHTTIRCGFSLLSLRKNLASCVVLSAACALFSVCCMSSQWQEVAS